MFAAKVVEMIEKHQISEAELAQQEGAAGPPLEVERVYIHTGKKVHNPGVTDVVFALAGGMSCRAIITHLSGEAVYGLVGDTVDLDYLRQIASVVIPSLEIMATNTAREYGEEKAGLVRFRNQFLMGAAAEIKRRLLKERAERSEVRLLEAKVEAAEQGRPCTALAVVTPDSLAAQKAVVVTEAFKQHYPSIRQVRSRSGYDGDARSRGAEAGRRIGLNPQIEGGGK